jgi:hypothetical protein
MIAMKITLKVPKPRNPLVLAARQRKAGAHEAAHPQRQLRRTEKQLLQQMLKGKRPREVEDA